MIHDPHDDFLHSDLKTKFILNETGNIASPGLFTKYSSN